MDFLESLTAAVHVPKRPLRRWQRAGDPHLIDAVNRLKLAHRRLPHSLRGDQTYLGMLHSGANGAFEALGRWCVHQYGSAVQKPGQDEWLLWLCRQYRMLEYVAPEDADIARSPERVFFRKLVEYMLRRFPKTLPPQLAADLRRHNSLLRAPFAHGDAVRFAPQDVLRYAAMVSALTDLRHFEK